MASWNGIFHAHARGSRAIGLGAILAIALGASVAPSGCTLPVEGASAGGSSATTSSADVTTGEPATTVTSATASSGTCGGAGCAPCVSDVDCGMPTFDGCTASICVGSFCVPKATEGLLSITQPPNDCMKSVCGADGKPIDVVDANDTPADDMNPCTKEECVGTTPTTTNAPSGTACTGGTCDGAGHCFNCMTNADCMMGATCDMAVHTCVSCSDGMQNGSETGVDCGGNCKKCDGTGCANDMECAHSACVDKVCCNSLCGGTCQACNVANKVGMCSSVPAGNNDPMTCMDPMTACDGTNACKGAGGKSCTQGSECLSNTCLAGVCRSANGTTCIDNAECASKLCMSGTCAACAADADCPSKMCVANVCKAPNGSPCDVAGDCAAGKCLDALCKLDNADPCSAGLDCASGFCTGGACAACKNNPDCPGSSCGMNATLGYNACLLPKNVYCTTTPPVVFVCGAGMCKGFPASCK